MKRKKSLSFTAALEIARAHHGECITIEVDGIRRDVKRYIYVAAKTKQLREFGYASLTEKDVDEQLTAVLAGKTIGDGLGVIGGFMKDEIVIKPQ